MHRASSLILMHFGASSSTWMPPEFVFQYQCFDWMSFTAMDSWGRSTVLPSTLCWRFINQHRTGTVRRSQARVDGDTVEDIQAPMDFLQVLSRIIQ